MNIKSPTENPEKQKLDSELYNDLLAFLQRAEKNPKELPIMTMYNVLNEKTLQSEEKNLLPSELKQHCINFGLFDEESDKILMSSEEFQEQFEPAGTTETRDEETDIEDEIGAINVLKHIDPDQTEPESETSEKTKPDQPEAEFEPDKMKTLSFEDKANRAFQEAAVEDEEEQALTEQEAIEKEKASFQIRVGNLLGESLENEDTSVDLTKKSSTFFQLVKLFAEEYGTNALQQIDKLRTEKKSTFTPSQRNQAVRVVSYALQNPIEPVTEAGKKALQKENALQEKIKKDNENRENQRRKAEAKRKKDEQEYWVQTDSPNPQNENEDKEADQSGKNQTAKRKTLTPKDNKGSQEDTTKKEQQLRSILDDIDSDELPSFFSRKDTNVSQKSSSFQKKKTKKTQEENEFTRTEARLFLKWLGELANQQLRALEDILFSNLKFGSDQEGEYIYDDNGFQLTFSPKELKEVDCESHKAVLAKIKTLQAKICPRLKEQEEHEAKFIPEAFLKLEKEKGNQDLAVFRPIFAGRKGYTIKKVNEKGRNPQIKVFKNKKLVISIEFNPKNEDGTPFIAFDEMEKKHFVPNYNKEEDTSEYVTMRRVREYLDNVDKHFDDLEEKDLTEGIDFSPQRFIRKERGSSAPSTERKIKPDANSSQEPISSLSLEDFLKRDSERKGKN